MVSSMMGSGWFLDSGASFHMTSDKILFSTLEEKDLQILIGMGNYEKYSVLGVGMVIFQREHGACLTLTDVKYVPVLKRSMVSLAMLEDRGYDVVFSKGKVFLRHIITRQVKQIGSRVKNLYDLEVQDACKALSSEATYADLGILSPFSHLRFLSLSLSAKFLWSLLLWNNSVNDLHIKYGVAFPWSLDIM